MDAVFIEGVGATVAATIVFCGSVFLLLAMIMGARLAYFVTASVTLAFLFIMGLIWSFTNPSAPLGPVGVMPEWEPISVVEEGETLEGPSGPEYQGKDTEGGGWQVVDEEDDAQVTQAAELGSAALDAATAAAEDGKFPTSVENTSADSDSVRLLEQDGDLYGAVTLEPPEPTEEDTGEPPPTVWALLQFDPGNPLGLARLILLGTTVLLILHLVGLSMSERKARRAREATAT
jgi:hypothetical protein